MAPTVPTTRDELSAIAQTLHPTRFPKQLGIEVTGACTLHCPMCHHDTLQRPAGRMPPALFRRCADEAAAVDPSVELWFSFNGEALLAPDLLLEMIAYAKAAGLRSLNLNTNGVCLDAALAARLMDSGIDLVVFGLDGLSREVYETVRRGASRDQVYANVEHFLGLRQARASGPAIMVQFIEMAHNIGERDAFAAYWLARGAIVKFRRQLSWGGRVETPVAVPAEQRIACPWAINLMHVFWDGTVPRCCADVDGTEAVGNAWTESLATLWQRLAPYRDLHLRGEFDRLPPRCATCRDWMVGRSEKIAPTVGAFRNWTDPASADA
ncbi:MAG TPA: radical SAM/SPASM domain-containing protein [Candidatus Kryptonia bacterium]|nr:radical SAM/SPASM domain-containing protein [Candidatus Kryptonia bacterium]